LSLPLSAVFEEVRNLSSRRLNFQYIRQRVSWVKRQYYVICCAQPEGGNTLTDSSNPTQFAVEVHKIKTGIHIETHGDLDLTTVRALDSQLHSSTKEIEQASPGEKIILDIRDLVFIDSAGLALMIKVSKQLAANDRVLRVVMKRGTQPERILKIGHFDKIIELGYEVND